MYEIKLQNNKQFDEQVLIPQTDSNFIVFRMTIPNYESQDEVLRITNIQMYTED